MGWTRIKIIVILITQKGLPQMKEGPGFRRTAEEERLELLRIPQTAHALMDIKFKPSTQKFKLNAYDCAVVSGHSAGRNIVCVAELNFPAGLDLEWAPFFTNAPGRGARLGQYRCSVEAHA